jgi:hypothetical protein
MRAFANATRLLLEHRGKLLADLSPSEDCQAKSADGEILTPIAKYGIETGGPGHTAFKKLKILLDRMMLR